MKAELIHPELRRVYSRIPALPIHNRVVIALAQLAQKLRSTRPPQDPDVQVEDLYFGCGRSRLYRPRGKASGAGLLWIHGGGYIIGDATINDVQCIELARELGLTVLSAEYRLAPKHPFPAGLDDCYEAWQQLLVRAGDWQLDTSRLAIIGQSAGGGLAAGLAQRIRDTGGVQPAAQVLVYPMIDDRTAANTALDAVKNRLWNNRNNRGAWRHYLGQAPGMEQTPAYAAPARTEDLSGLAPAWVGVGEADLFCAEDCEYARRLQAAGVSCELYTTPMAPHAFDMLVPDASVSQEFCESYMMFLRQHLAINQT